MIFPGLQGRSEQEANASGPYIEPERCRPLAVFFRILPV